MYEYGGAVGWKKGGGGAGDDYIIEWGGGMRSYKNYLGCHLLFIQ